MKPEQIQLAAEELLAQIQQTKTPANEVINTYTRNRRYIGSKDRRTLVTLVWSALRAIPTPEWLLAYVPQTELDAMQQEATTILRANGNREDIAKHLAEEGNDTRPTARSPLGLKLTKRTNLTTSKCYQEGLVEVQDEGSQLAALATHIQPNDTVLDYCAGAGGKSLVFVQMMKNQGQIVAHDISKISLNELMKRAKRAKATIITTSLHPTGTFAHVVVDAPCSGSGTWRRCPDARLKLSEQQVHNLVKKQAAILDKACAFVAPKGYLHYMTCSLIEAENQAQMRAFLKRHKNFKLIHHQQWTPATTDTDGFFLATFQKV